MRLRLSLLAAAAGLVSPFQPPPARLRPTPLCGVVSAEKKSPFSFADPAKEAPKSPFAAWFEPSAAAKDKVAEPASVAELRAEARDTAAMLESSAAAAATEFVVLAKSLKTAQAAAVKAQSRVDLAANATLAAKADAAASRGGAKRALRDVRDTEALLEATQVQEQVDAAARAALQTKQTLDQRAVDVARARQISKVKLQAAVAASAQAQAALEAARAASAKTISSAEAQAAARVRDAEASIVEAAESAGRAGQVTIKPAVSVAVAGVTALLFADAIGLDKFDILAALAGASVMLLLLPATKEEPAEMEGPTTD